MLYSSVVYEIYIRLYYIKTEGLYIHFLKRKQQQFSNENRRTPKSRYVKFFIDEYMKLFSKV